MNFKIALAAPDNNGFWHDAGFAFDGMVYTQLALAQKVLESRFGSYGAVVGADEHSVAFLAERAGQCGPQFAYCAADFTAEQLAMDDIPF